MITRDGKPKFETHEVEAPKKEKWKAKTKLKLQRKREKKKRKAANKRDPRRLGVKGKKKQKFDTPEERIKHKIENHGFFISVSGVYRKQPFYFFRGRALEKSKYEQSLESLRRFIAIAEKELELYYRHVAEYDDPNNRIAYSILDDSRSTSEKQNGKIGEENYSSSESIASDLELSQIDDGCVGYDVVLMIDNLIT
ncbi:hypothetical protein CQW23_28135 [Capsicum baccatum]|uniref:Uncharacterized protein n=1 Tax=Capsicum baccatum TaxID=33114 RepID=A0A2G2VFS0_CAPBA|nr:hypothetical protein CQW23_28135 [Capsicum baccatum]